MRVLVLGGAGFIGSCLVESLTKDKHDVVVFDKKDDEKTLKETEYFHGDITNKESMAQAFKEVDVVYHLVSLLEKWDTPEEDYWNVNFEGSKNVFDLSVENGVKQLIYASSASVIGPVTSEPLDENDPYDSSSTYKKTKIEVEKFLLSKASSIPITIIRPELVYGPGDLHHLKLFKMIKGKKFVMPTPGKNIIQPTYVDDIVQGFRLILMNKKAFGKKFIFAGNEIISSRQFVDMIAENLGAPVPKISIPAFISELASMSLEFLGKSFNFVPPITQSSLEFFTLNNAYDISFAKKELGYEPAVPLKEGINMAINWYKENGLLS